MFESIVEAQKIVADVRKRQKREIQAAYWHGDIVYRRIETESRPGMVTGINIRPTGMTYAVTWQGGIESYHYEIELTSEFVPSFE